MTATIRLDDSPYQRFLRVTCERAGDGEVVIRLPFREEFLRADGSDWLHGGVIAALIDIAGDYAIVTRVGEGVPTIDLRIDWLRPARKGDLLATGRVVRNGRRVSVADIEVHDEGGRLVPWGEGSTPVPSQELPKSTNGHHAPDPQKNLPRAPGPPRAHSSGRHGLGTG